MDRQVDQTTYSHVIRLWVKDVRDRSNQRATPSLEVSQLSSDSEVSWSVVHDMYQGVLYMDVLMQEDDAVTMATPRPLSFGECLMASLC